MPAIRNKGFIQQLTIHDLIATLGEEFQSEGLHVFKASEEDEKNPPYRSPLRADHFTIFLVTAGELRLKINLIDYSVKKNHLFMITPDVVVEFLDKSSGCFGMGMGFTTDFMFRTGIHKNHVESFDFIASQANPLVALEQQDTDILLSLFTLLLQKNLVKNTHPFGTEIVNHSFSVLLYELAAVHQKYNKGGSIQLNRKEHLLMRFLKLLPAHFKEQRSVQFYAELLSITPKYLTETVKEITGKTAGEFIDEMVVTEAKLLLSDPAMSVAGVADALYFSDQFFFSKFFKKQAGLSPSAYRKTVYK
jgi:AraC family transcriptional activator of pobA